MFPHHDPVPLRAGVRVGVGVGVGAGVGVTTTSPEQAARMRMEPSKVVNKTGLFIASLLPAYVNQA